MKLEPDAQMEMIRDRLRRLASDVYGDARAGELSSQIDHLAHMMSDVARQELDLVDSPLPGPADRSSS